MRQSAMRAYVQAQAAAGEAGEARKNAYDRVEARSADGFLNYIEYDAAKISPAKINSYLKAASAEPGTFALGGRCTGCRKGDFVLRQLDWYYNEEAEFVIRMKKCEAKGVKYDSIGVTACSPKLTRKIVADNIANKRYSEYFDMLPYMTVDGVNSAGVFAQSNVVEKNGVFPIDINPAGDDCCCSIMLVRFILDHVGSVSELDPYLRTLHLYSAAEKYIPYNAHILVCDKTGASKVIEFVKNADGSYGFELVDSHVMANFRTNGGLSVDQATGEAVWNTVEWNGMGVERWNRCAGFRRLSAATVENFKGLRKDLSYTHAYDRPVSAALSSWLTDNISADLSVSEAKMYHDGLLTGARKDRWDSVLAQYRAMYDGRSRETGKTWHTTHSGIYDLVNLSCNLVSQESESESWNVLSDGTMTRAEEGPQTVSLAVKAYDADTFAEISDPELSVLLSAASGETRVVDFTDIPCAVRKNAVVALSAAPTDADQERLVNRYYFKGWDTPAGAGLENPCVVTASSDLELSVGCGYKAVTPTTGGQWVARQAADGQMQSYFFKYDGQSGKWAQDADVYVAYDGRWKMVIESETYWSAETATDAKRFSVEVADMTWRFSWVESQAEVALSVSVPSDDAPRKNARVCLNGDEVRLRDGQAEFAFPAGFGETLTLSAGQADASVSEFSDWNGVSASAQITVSAESRRLSANYDTRKVLVTVTPRSGTASAQPENAALVIDGETIGAFAGRSYIDCYRDKSAGDMTVSLSVDEGGAYEFLYWSDGEIGEEEDPTSKTRVLPASRSHSLEAQFEKK